MEFTLISESDSGSEALGKVSSSIISCAAVDSVVSAVCNETLGCLIFLLYFFSFEISKAFLFGLSLQSYCSVEWERHYDWLSALQPCDKSRIIPA